MAENQSDARPEVSFEKSFEQLQAIVQELEGGDLTLDRTIELFEQGMALTEECRKHLAAAESRVEILTRKEGKIVAEPFRQEKR